MKWFKKKREITNLLEVSSIKQLKDNFPDIWNQMVGLCKEQNRRISDFSGWGEVVEYRNFRRENPTYQIDLWNPDVEFESAYFFIEHYINKDGGYIVQTLDIEID